VCQGTACFQLGASVEPCEVDASLEDMMKKAALLVSTLFVFGLLATGCKSDMEKFADSVCACAEKKGDDAKKCMDDVSKEAGDKMKGDKDKVKDMSDKDKEAFGKAMGCAAKAQGM
jgi:hypothetical protein